MPNKQRDSAHATYTQGAFNCTVVVGRHGPRWYGAPRIDRAGSPRMWLRMESEDVSLVFKCTVPKVWAGSKWPPQTDEVRLTAARTNSAETLQIIHGFGEMVNNMDSPSWRVPWQNRVRGGTRGCPLTTAGGHVLRDELTFKGLMYLASLGFAYPAGAGGQRDYTNDGAPELNEHVSDTMRRWYDGRF